MAVFGAPALSSPAPCEDRRFFGHVPIRLTPDADDHVYHFTPQHLAEDASIISLHIDFFGIPWKELMTGDPLPPAWESAMAEIEALRNDLGLPVVLSLTPLAGTRDRLAPRAFGDGERLLFDGTFGSPCQPLSERDDAAAVEAAYDAYVDHMVERFDPSFLAISIEVDLYRRTCPSAWSDLVTMLNRIYENQKNRTPGLPVFHTFLADFLWEAATPDAPCVGFDRSCVEENVAAMEALSGDLFALSSYPLGTRIVNGGLPDDFLTVFAELTGKPVAVAETGYQAFSLQDLDPEGSGECVTALPSSLQDQRWWMEHLLDAAEEVRMPFVIWWSDHDLMPEHASVPCTCEVEGDPFCEALALADPDDARLLRSFSTMGVRDYDGDPRPALEPWHRALAANALPEPPPGTPVLTDEDFPGFEFQVVIDNGVDVLSGADEPSCLAETLCVSGALPGRTELVIRIIGPRPNGRLWVNLVRFTKARLDVWIEDVESGERNHYLLEAVPREADELPGVVDTTAFLP